MQTVSDGAEIRVQVQFYFIGSKVQRILFIENQSHRVKPNPALYVLLSGHPVIYFFCLYLCLY